MNLSAGLDSGYYQTGLPNYLDSNEDGEITWAEWIVGHTEATETYAAFLE
jgi:hypothetical protein